MMPARFSIGIDLGTTNTALAFVPLDGAEPSEMFAIPQVESASAIVDAATLPSFLYLPESGPIESAADGEPPDERWIPGRFARAKAAETPGRVVHSAKSWLAHHSADRSAPFLPWGSDDVGASEKISPVRASALILRYVRDAWNDRFADAGDAFAFDAQAVTIAVPASFDAVAQRLTLAAARDAGYPETVRLLEEPQAALYRWLELHDSASGAWGALAFDASVPRHVLVVDIGGGTSDFSLFAFGPGATGSAPHIKRIAVSEHLLLGGDNMDLALAHRLEPQLARDGEGLSGRQWAYLVARCRDVKETALSAPGSPGDEFSVSIPGRGSRLIAQAQSAQLTRAAIETLLVDGFFPECSAAEYPLRTSAALRELGLPYARDPAVTRHLADFLRDRPTVDAVLFNGGSLRPRRLRERVLTEIGKWQSGAPPIELASDEPDLAVARGAARFGKLVDGRADRIEAGAAHAVFIQAHRAAGDAADDSGRALLCVLPAGAPTEKTFAIASLGLELRTNTLVRFQAFSSARAATRRAGDIVVWNERDFRALPALETSVTIASGSNANASVPVTLAAKLTELGVLEISCASVDPALGGPWPLDFNLRMHETNGFSRGVPTGSAHATAIDGPGTGAAALEAARLRIRTLFGRPIDRRDKLTATRLLKSLETLLGIPKHEWNVVLVRSLWETLDGCATDRSRSVDHEEAWLILAGFLLRPGFGVAMDEARIDRLWAVREAGWCFPAKTVKIQEYVMWRRVAGGLSAGRQEQVLAAERVLLLDPPSPPPELVLLAGSLERIGHERKAELIERFIASAATLERANKHNAQYLAALGALLNRAPAHGGPETVVATHFVQAAFETFAAFDWDGPKRIEWQTLFVRAARVVDNRDIDVPRSLRDRIADKLEKAGTPPAKTAPLRGYLPMQRAERAGSFGESLPPGFILRGVSE